MKPPPKNAADDVAITTGEDASLPLTAEESALIEEAFNAQLARNKALLDEIVFILQQRLLESGIKVHEVDGRVKKIDSVLGKCERKGVRDIGLLTDVVGGRVVCLFRSDMSRVAALLMANFDIVSVDDKLTDAGPLGYQSTHYVCQLPARYSGPRYENTAGVKFEIQVRTLCMHAWAAVSHHLDYKGDWDVPSDLKQALNALGGLFYVADNEFEQFYSARQKSKADAEKTVARDEEQELNLDTLTSYLKQKFPDRTQSSSDGISKLVKELKSYGYKSVQDLDKAMSRGDKAFQSFEDRHPPSSGRFAAEGVVRVTDRIVHDRRSIGLHHKKFQHLVKPE
jgi:putative GTP pyrophosphokinase